MRLRRSAFVKYIIAAVIFAAFYCEWFVYAIQPLFWPDLRCPHDENCTKILFIADPQIQGELAVPIPLNHLFIYDSDQYLISTFSVVSSHFKPDVLVYLGDIMDEGSISTPEQYQRYVTRIKNIFPKTYVPEAEVWVPGDNDIGGENEPIRKDKIEAFKQAFQNTIAVTSRNISYYKVNAITNTFWKPEDNSTDAYKIVISHYPVTLKFNLRNQVMSEIHPNIFFCAHSHESKYMKTGKDFSNRKTYWLLPRGLEEETPECNAHDATCPGKGVLQIDDEYLYEIFVPTCSYRMGTSRIGYGAAIYDHKNRTLRYTVFWSPQRFPYLFFYLVLLVVVIVYAVVFCAARCYSRYGLTKSTAAEKDRVPLLNQW